MTTRLRPRYQVEDHSARCAVVGCGRQVNVVTRVDAKGRTRGARLVSMHILELPPEGTPESALIELQGVRGFCPGSLAPVDIGPVGAAMMRAR